MTMAIAASTSVAELLCMTILRAGVVPMARIRGSNCWRFFAGRVL
jgi:hypothetical protein